MGSVGSALFAGRSRLLRAGDFPPPVRPGAHAEAARRLLPGAHPGWVAAAEAGRWLFVQRMAELLGRDVHDYIRESQLAMERLVDPSDLRKRMPVREFAEMVEGERFLTLFETHQSQGAAHVGMRMLIEHTILGVPADCPAWCRPVYGYLGGSDESSQVGQYGEVVLFLRKVVAGRSTYVCGDTLDHAQIYPWPAFVPQPVHAQSSCRHRGRPR
jgi:hypothetical protein